MKKAVRARWQGEWLRDACERDSCELIHEEIVDVSTRNPFLGVACLRIWYSDRGEDNGGVILDYSVDNNGNGGFTPVLKPDRRGGELHVAGGIESAVFTALLVRAMRNPKVAAIADKLVLDDAG